MKFKPMLAGKADANIRFPVLASPKLDGIRCIITDKGPVSRKLLPIPNEDLFKLWSIPAMRAMDGEIICGDPVDPNAFQASMSQVMRRDGGSKGAVFHVFDAVDDWDNPVATYSQRYGFLKEWVKMQNLRSLQVELVEQTIIRSMDQLATYEAKAVELGFEGVMIRNPASLYKFGRSGTKEGILLKVKRMEDTEGIVVGFEEMERNTNLAEMDALGHVKRSTAKAGKKGAGMLGALIVRCEAFPHLVEMKPNLPTSMPRVGTGFTEDQRLTFWRNRAKLLGKVITLRYQAVGVLDKPRFPSFKGFRED